MSARCLDAEFAHWQGRPLRSGDFARLRTLGVPGPLVNWSRGSFEPLLRAAVAFRRGARFDFARELRGSPVEVVGAYTVLARGPDGEPLDVVAWQPTTGQIASWSGAAGLLGEDFPATGTAEDPLLVFPDVPSWLAAERRGVVVVIERLARPALLEAGTIQGADLAHGEALKTMLRRVRLPRIVVPVSSIEQVAA